jgi:MFS family permease
MRESRDLGTAGRSGLLAAAYLAAAAGTLSQASFEFMMVPLQSELGLSADEITGLTLIPAAASLTAVFVVGALGDRLGARWMLTVASVVFAVGAVLVMSAGGWASVVVGRAVGGVGAIALSVTGLAMLNSAVDDERQRGRLFGYFAAVVPATFLVASLVASVMSTRFSWRVVPIVWMGMALVVLLVARRLRLASVRSQARGEMGTPLLAGGVLACIGFAAAIFAGNSTTALLALAGSAALAVILIVLMRRLRNPSLDLRLFRAPGAVLLCGAIVLATLTNLFFFVNLFLQYRFPADVVSLSLLMAVPQLFAIAGGVAGGRLSARLGPLRAAAIALLAASMLSLGLFIVRADSPMWVSVLVLAVFAVPAAGMVGPLTQSLMQRAPVDGSSAASSIKSATWSLGGILGGVTVGAVGFTVFTRSLSSRLADVGMDLPAAQHIAEQVRSGAFVSELGERLRVTNPPGADVLTGSQTGLHLAQVDALHTGGLAGMVTFGLAAVLVALAGRRISAAGVDRS